MRRGVRALPVVVLLPLVLVACGTEKAGSPGSGGGGGSSSGGKAAVDSAELKQRAGESALEHVYVTEIPGFTLARQSVGVIGDDGFSGTYVSQTGGQVQLAVDRGKLPDGGCDGCVKDGAHWYSATGGEKRYQWAEGGHVVRLTATGEVDRDTLRAAAGKTHPASAEEMDEVLPEARSQGGAVVERGDLPPVGDGAPRNDVGASG
ncbi:hypothetical protein [Streptomyces sp. NPDC051561]|uniref:hypothetical protein n=1 Tax=Streptomyces sp. NPDC051561 TaxID=3365658 RepID=UPI0037B4354D